MYRLLAKQNAQKVEFWRNGTRMRVPGVLLADGSFIKLLPNRPVDVSDSTMDINKALLDCQYVECRRLSVDNPPLVEDVKESIVIINEDINSVPIEDIASNSEEPAILVLLEDTAVKVDKDQSQEEVKPEDKKKRRR